MATAAKTHINKTQIIQSKFFRIILNKPRDTPIPVLHKMTKMRIIDEFIQDSGARVYNYNHNNPLINSTGNYNIQELLIRIRVRLPKYGTTIT